MLETDYEDLHGMGMEALMQFFDEYLAKELKEIQLSAFPIIEHNLVRATVTPEIIRLISKYYQIGENEALQRFYQSKTAENYAERNRIVRSVGIAYCRLVHYGARWQYR